MSEPSAGPSTPREECTTPSRVLCDSTTTPTPKANARRMLSQQRRRRRHAGGEAACSNSSRQGSTTPSTKSSSVTSLTSSKMASLFANTKRLPMRLPNPPLCLLSDPYADLCAHLRRHGLQAEAEDFASAEGITTDFALRSWISSTAGGAEALLNQTSTFLNTHATVVQQQIQLAQVSTKKSLPSHFTIPIIDLDGAADGHCLTPTHLLAVHGSSKDVGLSPKGLLMPCHAFIYVLQCVSLPAFNTSNTSDGDDTVRVLPVISLRVPRPTEFPTLHRFLYTRDTSDLLLNLLPMKHIARHWDHLQKKRLDPTPSALSHLSNQPLAPPASLPTQANSATDALSHLPTQTLFGHAFKIHSAWANGVAIGILDRSYWTTLDRAWNLVIAALSIKKARILDMELRGVQLDLGKARV